MERKNTLLILEDDILNQKVYKALLSKDYQVTICNDDKEFYAALKENEYNLFIIDLALQCEKDGIFFIKELRKMNRYKTTPVIVVTAFVTTIDRENSIVAGATKFLRKPFDNIILLEEIKKCLS